MILIGNQTSFAAGTPFEPFVYAVANGFDAFEWFPDKKPDSGWDETDLDPARRRAIRKTARRRGMRLSVHARWQANPLQQESIPVLRKDIELAKDLGAALLNIHLYQEAGLAAYVMAITPLVRQAAKIGLQVSIENTPLTSPEDFNELFARMRGLGLLSTGRVGMCLDLGHANLCAATQNRYLDFLDRLDPEVPIIHLHLHENWGDADSHLPLFTGPAGRDEAGIRGFIKRLRGRDFSGSIILEQWPEPPTLLNEARDKLIKLLREYPSANPSPVGASSPQPSPPVEERGNADRLTSAAEQAADQDDFADALIAADKRCRSWREKLEAVQHLLVTYPVRPSPMTGPPSPVTRHQSSVSSQESPGAAHLVDLAIYLRFLGTGQIRCEEDGRHFRPAHHARIALQIQERLAQLTTPSNAFIVRQIYPWLPSSAQTFQRAEPLTRIRDIAHRNDIPQDLKREIKNSLQNKLHRCAGPEDLATSTALLKRITAPGANYSPAFVEQFKIFHEELKEFFNARSLEDQLKALRSNADESEAALIGAFLTHKSATGLEEHLAAFTSLTDLRGHLLGRNDHLPASQGQNRLLADIALEDFAFVLASNLINDLDGEAEGRGDAQAHHDSIWQPLLKALLLTVTNLSLSRVEPEESGALRSELLGWSKDFDAADPEQLLRLKATVERSRRLAEDYSDHILELFPPRVEKLGRALGVEQHAIRAFCDAEIRGHLVFQLSKLASALLRRLRARLALPAWDVLVSGQTTGRLRLADQLDEMPGNEGPFPERGARTLLLLGKAAGDEEIPKAVSGIVLGHDLPHLSHLAVRARQAGVVFVVCEEAEEIDHLKALDGQTLTLAATPEKVEWKQTREGRSGGAMEDRSGGALGFVHLPDVRLAAERAWIPVEEAVLERGGGKADGARRLAELACRDGAGFKTPPALVVPFGVMEAALHASPDIEGEYRGLIERLGGRGADAEGRRLREEKGSGRDWDSASLRRGLQGADQLRALIQQVRVPEEIGSGVADKFGREARFMVRSSSNCEDLPELAGAGLYESVANVPLSGIASAVREVWSSLWTRRAGLSRQQAGIPHEQAHMAVLIQPMLAPDLSFVLHTVNPPDCNPGEVYAEAAVGLGETLVSGAVRGTPYRLVCDKSSGAVRTLAFASFSHALRPAAEGVARETIDYTRVPLSRDGEARRNLGRRLCAIGCFVEAAFQRPQDIEGVVVGEEIYLVQARPQQGVEKAGKRRTIN